MSKGKKITLWVGGIVIVLLLAWGLASGVSYIMGLFGKNLASTSPFLKFLPNIKSSENKLKGEDQDRVNILLLGMPGGSYPGPTLTDTIILLSIKPSTNQMAMLSIPRDMYVKAPSTNSYVRLNSIYTYGEEKAKLAANKKNSSILSTIQPTDGYSYLESTLTDILGVPIHYYMKMDFVGFEKIIDELGGIDVYVPEDIYDPYFPNDKYGYTTFKISKGEYHMDGKLALKYVRSRKTTSDFDRAKRQQIVLTAMKDKASKLSIFDIKKITNLLKIVGEHFKTDLTLADFERLIELGKNVDKNNIIIKVLDNSENGPLRSTNYDGASVLIPKAGLSNYKDIQRIAQNIFEASYLESEGAIIEIQNGTTQLNLANNFAADLKSLGLTIIKISNSKIKYEKTQIIDYTSGNKPHTIEYLKTKTKGIISIQNLPKNSKTDILIILGNDYKEAEQNLKEQN